MPNYEITMDVEDSGSGTIVDPTQLNDAGNAKRAEAWAVGQRNGVDVPSTDPTYHNNSKYYAQQAGSSAGSASSSADAAAAAAQHYPYVDSTSGNWMVWNTSTGAFVDTGVHAQGPTGPTGPGVPSGGTAGQVLKKVNGTDYNTEWANNDGTTIPMSSSDATTLNAAITSQNEAIAKYDPSSATALSDCNSAKETGRYKTVNNTSNTPFTGHFVLDVIRYNNLEISQVARFSYSTRVFVRGSGDNGSTWTSWEELALKSETQKFSFSTIVTDFNSALESGIYAGNSATNSPITGWVIVLTMRLTDNNNYIAQIALQFGNNYMYIRTRENGTWKSWKNVSAS